MSRALPSLLTRRRFLHATAAGVLAIAAAPGSAAPALRVPRVDVLGIQVIVDNATFGPFLPNVELSGLRVERAGEPGRERVSDKALMAEFGLSLLAESHLGPQVRRVLIDFDHTAEALTNNLGLLGIDPNRIDAAVLSHGHLDHYGAVRGVFHPDVDRRRSVPLFVGGEEAFYERIALRRYQAFRRFMR